MDGLEKALGDLARLTDRWMRTTSLAAQGFALETGPETAPPDVPSRLSEVTEFGDNPGKLRLFQYRPAELAADPALVVVLHGCTQTAAAYDIGSGWSRAADRDGFVLIYPEQQPGNNPKTCFNWYSRRDTAPGRGEAGSIHAMILWAMQTHGIAPGRVFITGLSAGGAMTVALLALYPELFAAGAIIAGMPFRAATTVSGALIAMFEGRTHTPREWGDLVRGASEHTGPWPRLSIWQGDADSVVVPCNAGEILKQWLDVHGLDPKACHAGPVDGYPRRVWPGPDGRPVIESWTIAGMGHGVPLDTHREGGGVAGPFMLDVGISSTQNICAFFGLTALAHARTAPAAPAPRPTLPGATEAVPPLAARLPPLPAPEPARPAIAAWRDEVPAAALRADPELATRREIELPPVQETPPPLPEEPPVVAVDDWSAPQMGDALPPGPLPGPLGRLGAHIGRRARAAGQWVQSIASRFQRPPS